MKPIKKRGQMQMSFGMIFSIILIIVFISFAFYVIKKVLDAQRKAEIGLFIEKSNPDSNASKPEPPPPIFLFSLTTELSL